MAIAAIAVFIAGAVHIYHLIAVHFGLALTWKDWVIVGLVAFCLVILVALVAAISALGEFGEALLGAFKNR